MTRSQIFTLMGKYVDLLDALEKVPYTYNVVLNDLCNIKTVKATVYNHKRLHNFTGKAIDFLCYIAVLHSMEEYPNCTLRLYFRNPKLFDGLNIDKDNMFKRFENEVLFAEDGNA